MELSFKEKLEAYASSQEYADRLHKTYFTSAPEGPVTYGLMASAAEEANICRIACLKDAAKDIYWTASLDSPYNFFTCMLISKATATNSRFGLIPGPWRLTRFKGEHCYFSRDYLSKTIFVSFISLKDMFEFIRELDLKVDLTVVREFAEEVKINLDVIPDTKEFQDA
jgi:hypothetical protein